MFKRENEGVYLFGSTRVVLRLDNGFLNVRGSNGELSINDFLNAQLGHEF